MRITTKMLDIAANNAGLPVNNSSLLDYISDNNEDLLSALTDNSALTKLRENSYEKLFKSADSLTQSTAVFNDDSQDNIFAKAREDGSNKVILDEMKELVDAYNQTLKLLASNTSTMNSYYKQALVGATSSYGDNLESIGVSINKDGSLSINENKFLKSSVDVLENVLGSSSKFTGQVELISSKIESNAEAYAKSLGNQYSSSGASYSSYTDSKYNSLG